MLCALQKDEAIKGLAKIVTKVTQRSQRQQQARRNNKKRH